MLARSNRPRRVFAVGLAATAASLVAASFWAADEEARIASVATPSGWRQHDVDRPKPMVAEPATWSLGAPSPAGAVVLFDGRNLDAWQAKSGGPAKWKVEEGAFVVTPGSGGIRTKEEFGDVQLHLEWASPNPPRGSGQNRGNSGVFLMGAFELQVIDSYQADTYADGMAGALYGQYPPLFNASRPPGEWQVYDVAFRAPRFHEDGSLREPARVTAFLNGVLVQANEPLVGGTSWLEALPYQRGVSTGPIELQDHNHPVKFRNIWVRTLPERRPPTQEERREPKIVDLTAEELESLTGSYAVNPDEDPLLVVTRRDDYLLIKLPFRATTLRVVPVSPLHFVLPYTDASVVFQRDEQGRSIGAAFTVGDGSPRVLTRIGK